MSFIRANAKVLGGNVSAKPLTKTQLREAAASAALRRAQDDKWCQSRHIHIEESDDNQGDDDVVCVEIEPELVAKEVKKSERRVKKRGAGDSRTAKFTLSESYASEMHKPSEIIDLVAIDHEHNDENNYGVAALENVGVENEDEEIIFLDVDVKRRRIDRKYCISMK